MLKVAYKDIRDFAANDITEQKGGLDFIKRDRIHRIAISVGRSGVTGLLFECDSVYYKVLSEGHNLYEFLC